MIKLIKDNLRGIALVCAIIAPIMMLLEVFMDLQQPTLMSDIIDIGVAGRNMPYVLSTGIKMVIFALLGFVGGASCCVISSISAMKMSQRLRQSLFNKIQGLSFSEIDQFKTSSLITRLTNDVTQVQNMMMMLLRIMVRAPFLCLGGIFMSFLLSPSLALIFCVVLPILICCIIIVMTKSMPFYIRVQQKLDRVNTVMRENLLGVRVVKTFNLEGKQAERFNGVNMELTENSIKAQSMTFLLMPIVTLVMNLSVVAVLWFGGRMVTGKSLETGQIMAFINYLVQITNSLMMVVNLLVNISRAQASGTRIAEVMAAESNVREPACPVSVDNCDIEFRNVYFRYSGSDYVLNDLSFSIRHGETVGIIGATGSGKSSLIGLIPRLYDASMGEVLIGGINVRDISLRELRRKIGVVLQDSLLFSGTIEDNLRFSREGISNEEIGGVLADSQAGEFIQNLEKGIESPVEQRGKNFSGGQKQRLSIARTLLQNPEILILDDSMSAVDIATEARFQAAVKQRMRGRTVIVIAQRISGVMDADKIIVLEHGAIAAVGSHSELIRQSEIYRNIVISQLGEEAIQNAYA